MKKDKSNFEIMIMIAITLILAIIAFVFTVGYIIRTVDPKHSITGYSIAISFIGIFATFGGAYLGAKISGDNARKLFETGNSKKDELTILKIDLFIQEMNADIKTLKKVVKSNNISDQKIKEMMIEYTEEFIIQIKKIRNCGVTTDVLHYQDAINFTDNVLICSKHINFNIKYISFNRKDTLSKLSEMELNLSNYIKKYFSKIDD